MVGESTFEIWLEPLEAVSWDGTTLLIDSPNPETRAWLADRFGPTLQTGAVSVLGSGTRVAFAPESRAAHTTPPDPGDRPRQRRSSSPANGSDIAVAEAFNPRYSFEQFVIGRGNRLAHAGALAVAELPGQAYNPLFLHAPPGLGKTHLLHAIGNYVLAFGGGATVRYTTVESFTNNFIRALGSHSLDRFKHAYRDADVLLIDDVQFLASKAKTEEEFFHTFNSVYETGRQLVLTCDRMPRHLSSVEERLRERFESGLVAEIEPPDHATRLTILRKRAALDRLSIADDAALELIAGRITENVRSLEGALIRVVAHHSLTGHPIDADLATAVLDELAPTSASKAPTVPAVQSAVAAHFGVTVEELLSKSRAARIAWPRQLAMFLARELTHASLPVIGQAFGGRDHATVHYACKKVSDRVANDPETSATITALTGSLASTQDDRDD
jgi:chromosomal replication initiator protein